MEDKIINNRNYSIDSLRLICALLVVFIHCDYPYKLKFLPVTLVAVPMFFCISGYFLYGTKHNWTRIGGIGKIFLWSSLIYLIKTEVFWILTYHYPWMPSCHNIVSFVVFNDVAFSLHLWYLPAYIYVLIFVYFIDKYNFWKVSYLAIIPLLLIGVCVRYFIADICPKEIQYYRNAYFDGLPFFLIGALIRDKCVLSRWFERNIYKIVLLIGILLLFISRYIVDGDGIKILVFHMINRLLLIVTIFSFTLINKTEKDNIISWLGRKYSLYIYI